MESSLIKYRVEIRKLETSEYQSLRKTAGWHIIDFNVSEKALEKDLYSLCVYDGDTIIGMGRIVGDGAIYFYIQDVVVIPEYQGKGVGKMIMDNIETYLHNNANHNSFVGLMAAEGVTKFYHQFGYTKRPENGPGMYKRFKSK